MHSTHFEISFFGFFFSMLCLSAALFFQWRYRQNQMSPAVLYSDLSVLTSVEKSWRVKLVFLPSLLKKLTFLLFVVALSNPTLLVPPSRGVEEITSRSNLPDKSTKIEDEVILPTEGIAIYFILDQSGSMKEDLGYVDGYPVRKRLNRIEGLKFFTQQFILGNEKLGLKGRSNDLVGLVSFARVPKILMPLTLDHQLVEQELSKLSTVNYPKLEGTAIGYAIYKTAHMIVATERFSRQVNEKERPSYDIKSTVMVLVTDGLQYPNHADRDHPLRSMGVVEAAKFAKDNKIKLYIVNIEKAIKQPHYAKECEDLRQAAEMTGGQFFILDSTNHLHRIYKVIDQVERSKQIDPRKQGILVEETTELKENQPPFERLFIFPKFVSIGLALLFSAFILETTLLRKVP